MFHFIHHCAVSFITYYFLADCGCAADLSLEVKYDRFKSMRDFSNGSKINGRCFSELNKLKI